MAKMTRQGICDELFKLEMKGDYTKDGERIQKLKRARDIIDAERAAEYKRLHPRP